MSKFRYLVDRAKRRHILVFLLALAGCAPLTRAQPQRMQQPQSVLFVCEFGTAKSAIAREMFRQRARQRGIDVFAASRGLMIEDHVGDPLRAKLAADGINPQADPTRTLAKRDWQAADIVVRFNPLPGSVDHNDIRDWSDLPSVNDNYAEARAILNRRIDALLDQIAQRRVQR